MSSHRANAGPGRLSLSIIIPVRPFGEGKSRLSAALDPTTRTALARAMFFHVLGVAKAFAGPERCHVVSADRELLKEVAASRVDAIEEQVGGLNAALLQASLRLSSDRPMLALNADLPFLAMCDLAAMQALLRDADVVIAADRAGTGTNALLLKRPGLVAFAFGPGSHQRHHELAEAAGLAAAPIRRPGLATDIDEPCDLALLGTAEAYRALVSPAR